MKKQKDASKLATLDAAQMKQVQGRGYKRIVLPDGTIIYVEV